LPDDLILSVARDPISGGWRVVADDGSVCETFATRTAARKWIEDQNDLAPRSEAALDVIREAVDAAALAYAFGPGAYTMVSLTASQAVERAYLAATEAPQAAAEGAAGGDMAGTAPEAVHGVPDDEPTGRLWRQDTEPST
jgi:hypothetical protein